MQLFRLNHVLTRLFMGAILSFLAASPDVAMAEPSIEKDRFDVSINLGQSLRPTFSFSLTDGVSFGNAARPSDRGFVSSSPTLPDSLHFAGLAGTLNLVIDKSTGSPVVEGIELAPRETLRFVADDNSSIRGLQGHISIRLDF